ncbi:MAG: DUF6159 family protein, partial [Candidatus Kariarchaeaceae archaeon]
FILAIFANYKGLDVIQDHAFAIIKWSYLISIGLFIGMMFLFGLLTISSFGIILIGIALLIAFLFRRSWPFILERIRRAAEWIKISVTIVLNEPGMIVLAFIQSIVVGITVIIEAISLIGWSQYAESQGTAENVATNVAYLIMFLYLWLALSVVYYFDGANTFISYARIHGKDPTVGQGLNAATKKILSIIGYAFISAVVYFITRLAILQSIKMQQESDNMGQVIAAVFIRIIAQIALWLYHLVSFFTLPSIIIRQKTTTQAMGESKDLFRRTFWDMIISDMGYGYASNILYIVTGLILAVAGFAYGFLLGSVYDSLDPVTLGIIVAVIALFLGLFASKFFLKPVYTALVTTIYVYATEGPAALKIVNPEMKSYLQKAENDPRFLAENQRNRRR